MIVPAERQPGQLLLAGFQGTSAPPDVVERIRAGRLGGVILFARNLESPAQVARLTEELRAAAPEDLPLIVAVDQEGGRVQRLPGTRWPAAAALGRGAPEVTREVARAIGSELAAVGINMDLAPVLDVWVEPRNTVIGDRAFGGTVDVVAQHGQAFVEGLHEAGVAACGKHFPGHGRTVEDSHLELPVLDLPMLRLREVELGPFCWMIGEGLDAIMTAHVVCKAIDPDAPATLSFAALTELLRGELGFGGLTITDCMEMKAISDHHGVADAVAAAVSAGADLVLFSSRISAIDEAYATLAGLQGEDPYLQRRLAESAARVAGFKRRRLASFRPGDPAEAARVVGCAEHRRLAERAAAAAG